MAIAETEMIGMTTPSAPTSGSPRRSRALLWIGCGALPMLIIGGVVLGVFALFRFAKSRYTGASSGGPGAATAEVRYLRWWDEGSGDPLAASNPHGFSRCFVGALVNTGSVPIRADLNLTFHDSAKVRVGAHSWHSTLDALVPGEAEPISTCTLTINVGTGHTQSLEVRPSSFPGRILPIETLDVVTTEVGPRRHEVTGIVRNNSGVDARKVHIVVTLLGATNEIVGGVIAHPAGGPGLASGESARFRAQGLQAAIEKARVEVRAVGYDR